MKEPKKMRWLFNLNESVEIWHYDNMTQSIYGFCISSIFCMYEKEQRSHLVIVV